MNIFNKIKNDHLQSRKNKDSFKSALLSVVIGEVETKSKIKGNGEITDEQVLSVITKIKKSCDENYENYKEQKFKDESDILLKYLPTNLSDEDLRNIISNYVSSLSEHPSSIGPIMGFLKNNYSGQFDGKIASSIAKELI